MNYFILTLTIFMLTFFFLKKYIDFSFKYKLIDKPDNLKIHKKITPTGCGIVFLIIFLINILLIYKIQFFKNIFQSNEPKNFYILISSLFLLGLISFYDDIKNIHPVSRLFLQFTIIFIDTSLFDFTLLNINLKILIFLVVYFWVYLINIINFSDGVDGFLSINAINFFTCLSLFYFIYDQQNFFLISSLIVLGIMLAYILLNRPPALVFMGDTGSIFLGFLTGLASIQLFLINRYDIVISLLSYTFIDCTLTLFKKVLKGQLPWARLFDYFFLIPIKSNFSHQLVFKANLAHNFLIFIVVCFQIYFKIKILFLISIFSSLILIYYFNSFKKIKTI